MKADHDKAGAETNEMFSIFQASTPSTSVPSGGWRYKRDIAHLLEVVRWVTRRRRPADAGLAAFVAYGWRLVPLGWSSLRSTLQRHA
jgi:hypothetical protein